MQNPFKKREPSKRPTDPLDELANRLQREGRWGELDAELLKVDRAGLTEAEQESWWHLFGISAFHARLEEEATARFEEAHRRFPSSARIRFSLGQQYVRSRRLDRGFELFRSCLFPAVPAKFAMVQARYAYLWDRYEDGRLMLRPISDAYKQLKILDDTFLHIRGLPFFGTWWASLAALSILERNTTELEEVTEHVVQHCRDFDFEYLKAELIAYRDDRPECVLGHVESIVSKMPKGFPTGYGRMNAAVIKSRVAPSQAEAEAILDSVVLTDRDFRWLQDVRTLARAEIAHRNGQPELERQRIDEFLSRQAMLFEPEIAVRFHLLRYQERLKPKYQGR